MKLRILVGVTCLFWLYGCHGFGTRYPVSLPNETTIDNPTLTAHILTVLQERNRQIKSYKGIGRVNFSGPQAKYRARFVFAGKDQKLRFEILSIAGQPATSLAYDGDWLFLIQHAENRFYQKKSLSGDLRQLITIPLTIRELIALLAGRAPLIEHGDAVLKQERISQGYILVLYAPWPQRDQELVYLDSDRITVRKYERFDGSGKLIYAAEIKKYDRYGDYWIPQQIEYVDANHHRLLMNIEKYWPNAATDASLFVLKKPDTARQMK